MPHISVLFEVRNELLQGCKTRLFCPLLFKLKRSFLLPALRNYSNLGLPMFGT